MITKKEVKIVQCDVCGAKRVLENFESDSWVKLVNPRTENSSDPLSILDFCGPKCVISFVNSEIRVERLDGERLLAREDSYSLGIGEYTRIFGKDK